MEVPPSPHPRVKSIVFREFPHIVLKHLTDISFDQKQKKDSVNHSRVLGRQIGNSATLIVQDEN